MLTTSGDVTGVGAGADWAATASVGATTAAGVEGDGVGEDAGVADDAQAARTRAAVAPTATTSGCRTMLKEIDGFFMAV
ncbi:MAG: hypothetical protein HY682_12270 [Chloroflexi bacterium]|nr:hypothetical protein [Chloroflexota bacterium]